MANCYDCERPYGDKNGFPDLVIPDWAWKIISPKANEGGLLCPSCICKRLYDKGIRCEGAFTSGPIISVTEETISALVHLAKLLIESRNFRNILIDRSLK